MRIIDVDLSDVFVSVISAGYIAENMHTQLRLKLPSNLIGEYEYRISMQSGDVNYLTDLLSESEGMIFLELSSVLTNLPELKVQIIAIDDNSTEVGKSKIITLNFGSSLNTDGVQPPIPGNPPKPRGLPPGGEAGDALVKEFDEDYATKWEKSSGILRFSDFSHFPSTAIEGRVAYAEADVRINHPYDQQLEGLTVDEVRPVEVPDLSLEGYGVLVEKDNNNYAEFGLRQVQINGQSIECFEYCISFETYAGVDMLFYYYSETEVEGYIETGWNLRRYVNGVWIYEPINYEDILSLTNVPIEDVETNQNPLRDNVMFADYYRSGYYSFTNADGWKYRRSIVDIVYPEVEGGRSAIGNDGIVRIPPYLRSFYIGHTQYGGGEPGEEETDVTVPASCLNNLYQRSSTISANNVVYLNDKTSIFIKNIDSTGVYSFDIDESLLSEASIAGTVLTFELIVNMIGVGTIEFSNITWLNDDVPSLEGTGYAYAFAFRKIGGIWIGNLQGRWLIV